MASLRTTSLRIAVAAWSLTVSLAPLVSAATCSAADDSRTYQLYQAVAADPVCSPYVTSGINVKWTCDTTPDCTVLQQQLAEELPNCESSKDGTNYRSQLNNALYSTCKLCTLDQLRAFSALTKQVSQSAACSPYSNGDSGFTWPCTATGCTAVVKSVSKDVPSCNYAGDNLQARVLNDIEACTGTSVSTTRPPSGGASGDQPSTPSSTSSPSTSTSTPSPSSVSSSGDEEEGSAPSTTTTSPSPTPAPKSCTTAETATVRNLLAKAANSSSCADADTFVSTSSVAISAKCGSPCIEQSVRPLAETLPDCKTQSSLSFRSARGEVLQELESCDRAPTADSRTAIITVYFPSASAGGSSSDPTRSVSASAAASLTSPAWSAVLLAAVTAFLLLLRD